MLVSLEATSHESAVPAIATYSVQSEPHSTGLTIDDVLTSRNDVHLVVFVPSLDREGLDDAACLNKSARRIHELSGDRVAVTLPFVRGNADTADTLRVAQAIRDDIKGRGHQVPRPTFLLYLELQPQSDGSTDLVGFTRAFDALDDEKLDQLATTWREAADKLATGSDVHAPGAFYRAVHGRILPSKLEWILAAGEVVSIATTIKKWLGLLSPRG